jgi:hypothetical protein
MKLNREGEIAAAPDKDRDKAQAISRKRSNSREIINEGGEHVLCNNIAKV